MKKQALLNYKLLQLIITIATFSHYANCTTSVFILVHGTWGRESEWYLPQGDFFDALEINAHKLHAKVISFSWSGGNNNKCRNRAAQALAKLILSYPDDIHVHLVTHSHGSNVGILASQILATHDSSKYHIDQFYALGTPVDANLYIPDMRAIHWFYHFFSLGDFVQPVFGLFDRCYPPHERLANIRILIDGKSPGHKGLHAPMIATWLPAIHKLFAQQKIGGFEHFDFSQPGLISFRTEKLPKYEFDVELELLLKKDHDRMIAITQAVRYASKSVSLDKLPTEHTISTDLRRTN